MIRHIRSFALAFAFATAIAGPALADSVSLDGVPKDKADQIRQLLEPAKVVPAADIAVKEASDKVQQYTDLGKAVGAAFKATATEMGVNPDEFAKSNLGYFTYFWLAWELWLGETTNTLTNVVIGIGWMLFAFGLWSYYFRKICMEHSTVIKEDEEVIYDKDGNDTGKTKRVKTTTLRLADIESGTVAGYRFMFFVIAIIISIPGWVAIIWA